MALDWLTEPVAPDAPCGPDLEQADDGDFLDYYYDAEGRLPERYITSGHGLDAEKRPVDRLFDAKAVDIKSEWAQIEPLLRRSRDLRLLSVLARWEALAWRMEGLADALEGMATLIGTFGDTVHPALPDQARNRRGAIEALCHQPHLIQPLHHFPLIGAPEVTWRQWLIAQGKVERRPGENAGDAAAILGMLEQKSNDAQLEKLHSDLSRMIRATHALNAGLLAPLTEVLEGIAGLIANARPDLETPAPPSEPLEASNAAQPIPAAAATPSASLPTVAALTTRVQARAALQAVENYLAAREPSSAALLLIIQSRRLIGKPLVEALDTLLPAEAKRAVIKFDTPQGFTIPMERLRELSTEIPTPSEDRPPKNPPQVDSRAQAAAQLAAVAGYFRTTEPASPIPVLLVRAQSWLERDFESLLGEIVPPQSGE